MNNEQLILQKLDIIAEQNVEIRSQNVELRSQNLEIQNELAYVRKKVDNIEAQVLVIRGRVCSLGGGMSDESRKAITEAAEAVTEEPIEEAVITTAKEYQVKSKTTKTKAVRKGELCSVRKTLHAINGYQDQAEETAFGQWFAGFTKQLFGLHLKSAYHVALQPLMEASAYFYLVERDHGGRKY